MNNDTLQALVLDAHALQNLIGQCVTYLHKPYEIIDILIEEDALVLESRDCSHVQDDCYGRARRMVPEHTNLRFRDEQGKPTHIWDELTFVDTSSA